MTIVAFRGKIPAVAESCWLAPTCSVIGRVQLSSEVSVFFGAVLRGDSADIVVGERSNLQDNVVVHADPGYPTRIGTGVSVGHGAVVHGCTIGDDCLVGMNATVLNGAIIGEGCLVAAGAVVLEGAVVSAGSLVAGVPAKVRRPLTDEEREAVRQNARNYVALSREYSAQ